MTKPNAPAVEWWPVWIGLLIAALVFVGDYFGDRYRPLPALLFMASIGFTLAAHWRWKGHVLFWLAALVLVAVHTALVLHLPWSTWKMRGSDFMPFVFLDFFANVVVIRLTVVTIRWFEREARAL
jgi:hypothetical protein